MVKLKLNLVQKIFSLFAIILIPFFILIGMLTQKALEDQVLLNANESVAAFTLNEGKDIENHFREIEKLGLRSVEFIKQALEGEPDPRDMDQFHLKYKKINNALRTNLEAFPSEDISAAFLSNLTPLNHEIKKIILMTEGVFDHYAKAALNSVFNMYLITKHQLIRIYKKDWALEIEPDHDFRKDIFYYVADPKNSPDRKAKWTEPYYDSIWKHWMTSLITPIYINDKFLGVIGHDVILDDIYDNILKKKIYDTGYGFVFNQAHQLVIHPRLLDRFNIQADMGEELDIVFPNKEESTGFEKVLKSALTRAKSNISNVSKIYRTEYEEDGKSQILHVYKLDFLDWRYAINIPRDELVKMLPQFTSKLINGAILVGVFLFFMVIILVWFYVISPVVKVSKATKEIGEGNLDYRIAYTSSDEIGLLVDSFNTMTASLKDITASRDQLNQEVAVRKQVEAELKKHQGRLEELVVDRTKDLQKSNKELKNEISVRLKAEAELEKLRNLLSNIINSMPSVIVGVDQDGVVTQWNLQAETVTGVSAETAHGNLLEDVFPELSREMDKMRMAIRNKTPQRETKVSSQEDGNKRYSDITIYPLVTNGVEGAVIRIDDVTEKMRIEEMIIQSEKMLSVGGLAAGMAHEINNPLASILQNMQVMRNRLEKDLSKNIQAAEKCGASMKSIHQYMEDREILNMISMVLQSGQRASKIVNNMLSFSRKSETEYFPHNLESLLDETLALVSNDYDLKKKFDFKRIKVIREFQDSIPDVMCEGNQIQQVFLNILKNGAQAMSDYQPIGATLGDWGACFIIRTFKKNNMAYIEIEDNGPGMEDKVRKRIFEPFFTTKGVGYGVGLGLSVSYFIITENHKGNMVVESTPGKGTKFIISLPFYPAA